MISIRKTQIHTLGLRPSITYQPKLNIFVNFNVDALWLCRALVQINSNFVRVFKVVPVGRLDKMYKIVGSIVILFVTRCNVLMLRHAVIGRFKRTVFFKIILCVWMKVPLKLIRVCVERIRASALFVTL